MKNLMAVALIVFGGIWIFWATTVPKMMRVRAAIHSQRFEKKLKGWADDKVADGHLKASDVQEIFKDDGSLSLSIEEKVYWKMNFAEMIDYSVRSAAPPLWPGIVAALIGGAGLFSCRGGVRIQEAEQAVAPNRSLPPTLKSTSAVRGPED